MSCSAVSLSLCTIMSVFCVAALAIAFSTDNWWEIRVDRNATLKYYATQQESVPTEFDSDLRFYSRDEGLFRICFPQSKPKSLDTYVSPTQTDCINVNYHIPDDEVSDRFSDSRWERTHLSRGVILTFVISFFLLFLSFFTGIAGCWKRSHANLVATGVLQLLASCFTAGGMGLFHAVQFYDQQKLKDDLSYAAWPEVLKSADVTTFSLGWSYMCAWVGTGLCFISSIIFLSGAKCIRREKRQEQMKNMQYLMPMYPDKRNPYSHYSYMAYPPPYTYHGATSAYGPQPQQQGGPYPY